jgi:hypothetical protein
VCVLALRFVPVEPVLVLSVFGLLIVVVLVPGSRLVPEPAPLPDPEP